MSSGPCNHAIVRLLDAPRRSSLLRFFLNGSPPQEIRVQRRITHRNASVFCPFSRPLSASMIEPNAFGTRSTRRHQRRILYFRL
jgi:hypothetical protein